MACFNKLRCPRNTLHINLFISFVLRAVVILVREAVVIDGVGLSHDITDNVDGTNKFRDDITHWECRLLFTCVYLTNVANYTWIFIEGLHLHNLIFVAVFSEHSSVKWYIVFGWVFPVTVILPWVIVRVTLENVLCWNTHKLGYFWIIKAPIAITIVVNFLFFLNIVRVLYTKLYASGLPFQARHHRNKRLAKSTLVLIPLFGVPYVIFLLLVDEKLSETWLVVKLYMETTFNAFNGLIVATVFCFFNGEVQTEVSKRWESWRASKTTSLTGLGTGRSVTNVSIEVQPYPGSVWHGRSSAAGRRATATTTTTLTETATAHPPRRSLSVPAITHLLLAVTGSTAAAAENVDDCERPSLNGDCGGDDIAQTRRLATSRRPFCRDASSDGRAAVVEAQTVATSKGSTTALVDRRAGTCSRQSYGLLDHTVGGAGATGRAAGGDAGAKNVGWAEEVEQRRRLMSRTDYEAKHSVTSLTSTSVDCEPEAAYKSSS
jgi:hypothetical protein